MSYRNIISAPKVALCTHIERASQCEAVKSPVPALGMTAMRVEGSTLYSLSSDVENTFTTSMDVEVVESSAKGWRILVSGDALAARVAAMPEGDVLLEILDGDRLRIRSTVSKRAFEIPGLAFDHAPRVEDPPTAHRVQMPARALRQIIGGTKHAISTDVTRPHVNAALFTWRDARVSMVGTDGHRIALTTTTSPVPRRPFDDALLPLPAVAHLLRILDWAEKVGKRGEDTMIEVVVTAVSMFVVTPIGTYSTKLRDGQYPPYQSVIPSGHNPDRIKTIVSREAFRAAIVAVRITTRQVGVDVVVGGGKVKLSTTSPETGDAADEVPCDYMGPDHVVRLNDRYTLDALDAIDSDEIEISIGTDLDPVTILPHHPTPNPTLDHTSVVMPMRR